MTQCCEEIDLPTCARVTVDHLDETLDPCLRVKLVLRVELPHSIRIDATWDSYSGGYCVEAWQPNNGEIKRLAVRWSQDKEAAVTAVEKLSRQMV